jgi:glyoxylase-like metal-dependent hydrolase (beta-lactamase superfamily II)
MTAIRKPGKVNPDTTLIDFGIFDLSGVGAVYLIQAGKTCLIDTGDRNGVDRIIRALKEMNAFPDMIILTHPHWDHCQGVPTLRKQAMKMGREIEVMASDKAIPLLADQAWSIPGCENITGVTPLKQGDMVDLKGITLQIFDTPGHCTGHISILDQKNGNIFVGDVIGIKASDKAFTPNFFLPFWDPDAFYASMDLLKHIDYDSLCLAHFGYIYGNEAKDILDEAVASYEQWWKLFERNVDRLDDIDYMQQVTVREMGLVPPEMGILSLKLKLLNGLLVNWNKLTRKQPQSLGEYVLRESLRPLIETYKTRANLTVGRGQE